MEAVELIGNGQCEITMKDGKMYQMEYSDAREAGLDPDDVQDQNLLVVIGNAPKWLSFHSENTGEAIRYEFQ